MCAMKKQHSLQIVLAGIALILINACATYPRSGPMALSGTWTNSLGTVWSIHSDGTFDVDLNKDGKRDAWGKYKVTGDTVTIFDSAGSKVTKDCKGEGSYHFSRTAADALHFALIKDSCKLRVKNVTLDWHRK
jgi:hypothetical protein